MWDWNPKMTSSTYSSALSKAGQGEFYQWTREPEVDKNFNGCIQLMKNYVVVRSDHLDALATDLGIPNTPMIQYTGVAGFPVNGLQFTCSAFSDPQGDGTFAAMQWRAGEVLDTNAPAYTPSEAPPYEITARWESGELTNFNSGITIPPGALKVGHAYRVRVRMMDNTGRWSHWSAPVQFIAGAPDTSASLLAYLRVSEVMYNPVAGSDYEFIELHNTSTNLPLEIGGAAFTAGVDYNFPANTAIAPGGYLLVIPTTNTAAFRVQYGLDPSIPLAGPYSGRLDNAGEQVTLKTAPGGVEISSFNYKDSRHWPLAADGGGHSLVPLTPGASGQATGALDYPGNWRASTFIGGSPGQADPAPPAPAVRLSEVAAHTDYLNPSRPEFDSDDWIELVNTAGTNINLDGWYLSDDPEQPAKWAIPAVDLAPNSRVVFSEVGGFHDPITTGFGLDKAGEQVLLSYLPGGAADRVVDAVGFSGQENGRSLSRLNEGDAWWYVTTPTSNAVNSGPVEGLRITEFMYEPPELGGSDNARDEFIEICNPTASGIALQSAAGAWRLDGGISYTFPTNTVLPAGEALLVVSFAPTDAGSSNAFAAAYGITNSLRLFGPWSGKLGNRSDVISLEKPQEPDAVGDSYSWVLDDEVVYGNQAPWPTAAAGGGMTLQRIHMYQHGCDPANWSVAPPTPGIHTWIALDPPQLGLQWDGAQLQLVWPGSHIGWQLQTKSNLLQPEWADVSGSVGTNIFLIPMTNSSGYYRLMSP